MERLSKAFQLAMLGIVVLCASGLARAQDIRYNFLPGTNFSQYKTYKWVKIPNIQYPNQLVDAQIMQSIDKQMALKGFTKSEDNPDILLAYQASVDQEKQWNSYSTGGTMWGWGGWGGWGGLQTTTTTSQTINVGTLNLDMYDAAKKQQIWRGEASKTLGSGKDPKKVQKNLDKAMAKLFKKYPPPAK